MVPEDRCHLNGLAMRDGKARYCTAVSRSDLHDAWRDKRQGSGVAIDVVSNEIVCTGPSMPHSPRWYKDTLWLIDSGKGFFGRENRTFQDLDLEENLKARDTETRCGLHIIDLNSFDAPHWLRFGGIVKELYDVGVLPGVIRPMAIGFKSDEIRRYISFE